MDANFTKRRRVATILHLSLTALVGLKIMQRGGLGGQLDDNWSDFWLSIFYFLQPPFFILEKLAGQLIGQMPGIVEITFVSLMYGSIPVWCFCFGWIYGKAVERLSHLKHF